MTRKHFQGLMRNWFLEHNAAFPGKGEMGKAFRSVPLIKIAPETSLKLGTSYQKIWDHLKNE